MKVITSSRHSEIIQKPAADLAAWYKWQGLEWTRAWSQFVIDRSLRPEMDARDFYALFDNAIPMPLVRPTSVQFEPTHKDSLLDNILVQITQDETGVYYLLWEDGHTGTDPPTSVISKRYHVLKKEEAE